MYYSRHPYRPRRLMREHLLARGHGDAPELLRSEAPISQHSFPTRLQIGLALARFLVAPDWLTAACLLVSCPLLLQECVVAVLRNLALEASVRNDPTDAACLQTHVELIEYAQRFGVKKTLEMVLQSE